MLQQLETPPFSIRDLPCGATMIPFCLSASADGRVFKNPKMVHLALANRSEPSIFPVAAALLVDVPAGSSIDCKDDAAEPFVATDAADPQNRRCAGAAADVFDIADGGPTMSRRGDRPVIESPASEPWRDATPRGCGVPPMAAIDWNESCRGMSRLPVHRGCCTCGVARIDVDDDVDSFFANFFGLIGPGSGVCPSGGIVVAIRRLAILSNHLVHGAYPARIAIPFLPTHPSRYVASTGYPRQTASHDQHHPNRASQKPS